MRVTSEDILSGPLVPTLYRMIWPAVVGHLVLISFGVVDTFFISLLGSQQLAAITFTLPVNLLLYNLMFGLGIGASILVGQLIGRDGIENAARASSAVLLLGSLIAIIIAIIGYLTIDPLFILLGASKSTLPYIREYMVIWYLCTIFLFFPVIGNSILRATGDTRMPSMIMVMVGLLNAFLDPILIFGLGPFPEMGIEGAITATVISWMVACFGIFWLLHIRDGLITLKFTSAHVFRRFWGRLIAVSGPISLSNMMMPVAMAALTWLVARHGDIAVAGMGAGGRIEFFAMSVTFAMATSLAPFMAQNIGAGNTQRVRQSLFACLKFTILFQLAAVFLFAAGSQWFAGIFTDEPQVESVARLYLLIMPMGAALYAILMVFNTSFNSHQLSHLTLFSNAIRVFVFYIPLIWLGNSLMGLTGVFFGAVIANGLGTLLGWYLYKTRCAPLDNPSKTLTSKPA